MTLVGKGDALWLVFNVRYGEYQNIQISKKNVRAANKLQLSFMNNLSPESKKLIRVSTDIGK